MAWFQHNEYGTSIRIVPFAIWLHFSTYPTWASGGRNADGSLKIVHRGRAFRFGWTYNVTPGDYDANAYTVLGSEFND